MKIAASTVAAFEFTLHDDEGNLLDSSEGQQPLAYVHGSGTLIPGLEQELAGKQVGDAFEVRIEPARAYGERDAKLVHAVPRAQLPRGADLRVGMQLRAESPDGQHIVTIVGFEGDQVQLDANHPLAGVALNFAVRIVDVRAATREELAHRHVHGPGGHAH